MISVVQNYGIAPGNTRGYQLGMPDIEMVNKYLATKVLNRVPVLLGHAIDNKRAKQINSEINRMRSFFLSFLTREQPQ